MSQLLSLSDGRKLHWTDNGIDSTDAIVLHHGTSLPFAVWNAWLEFAATTMRIAASAIAPKTM